MYAIRSYYDVNIPTRFSDAFEVIKENFEKIKDKTLRDEILPWLIEFDQMIEEDIINTISKKVLNLRLVRRTPLQISKVLHDTLNLQTYSGDIYSYLETSINTLDAVERIGNIYNKKVAKDAENLKKKLENPYKN